MNRPRNFSDIIGHDWLIDYVTTHIRNNTLPQFLIFEGPEGLGKTSVADLIAINLVYGIDDCDEKSAAIKNVIESNGSNDYIKRYKCSVEGGRDVAKEILTEMTGGFMLDHKKVIICDECHNLSDAAQDVFLADTEFMRNDVYLIMLTTDPQRLKASLRSRAVSLHFYPLKQADMVRILKKEVAARNLNIQNEDITLNLICEWAEYKPRTGLNMLKAFANGDAVSSNTIRNMIGVLDVEDVLPLLESLSASMSFGLNYIADMKISDSLVSLVAECYKVKTGNPSYKIQYNKLHEVKQRLANVTEDQLVRFLAGITRYHTLTRNTVINAYIMAHSSMSTLTEPNTKYMLRQEIEQKSELDPDTSISHSEVKAPAIEDLLANSAVVVAK